MQPVTIVVPCYNEAQRLPARRFIRALDRDEDFRFLFVNDGSIDGTADLLDRLCRRRPDRLEVLHLEKNGGKAEAVRRGMLQCLQRSPAIVGFWDADLSTPLAIMPRFLRAFERRPAVQMVIGSRVKLMGRQVQRSAVRHYVGRCFATAAGTLLGLPIYDTQCGAKMFRVDETLQHALAEPFLSRWVFDVELIARYIQAAGHDRKLMEQRIYELPLPAWRAVGGSKLRPADFATAAIDLLRIRSRYG